jgi:hypothetical protein
MRLNEAFVRDLMRGRMAALLEPAVTDIEAPAELKASALAVCVEQGMLGVCSTADVLDCLRNARILDCMQTVGTPLPVQDLCDMHTAIGHRALMKMLVLHPIVAKACGLDADRLIEDPVILASSVSVGLTVMSAERRERFLDLFRDEHARVAEAAGRATGDMIRLIAGQSADRPELAVNLARLAASLQDIACN